MKKLLSLLLALLFLCSAFTALGEGTAAAPGEPIAKGDGIAPEEKVLLMMRYEDYCGDRQIPVYYEDLVRIAGVEGKDGGNDGANSMTEYGDRIIFWYITDSSYVYYTFRRTPEEDVWTTEQWASQNIDRAKWEGISESELLPYLPKADTENMEAFTADFVPFMGKKTGHIKLTYPKGRWNLRPSSDNVSLNNSWAGELSNVPSIEIRSQVSEERVHLNKEKFENLVEDLPERTIAGVSFKCRKYKYVSEIIEYYAKLSDDFWLSVKLNNMEDLEGTEADLILKSIEVTFD